MQTFWNTNDGEMQTFWNTNDGGKKQTAMNPRNDPEGIKRL